MKTLLSLTFALIILQPMTQASAQKRCPANDMDCTSENIKEKVTDRVEQGKKEVKEAPTVAKKAEAVKSTIKDCTDCGMKVIKDTGGNIAK